MILKNIHETISFMPFVIIGYWLFCALFLVKFDFYADYFELFDLIDTIIVSISLLHFLFLYTHYSKKKKKFLICIVLVICLNFCYLSINIQAYYFIYYCLIFATILDTLWKRE